MTFRKLLPLFTLASAIPALAQSFDSSNNAALSGNYYVREVLVAGQNTNGTITSAQSVIGTINFDGKGNYTFNGQAMSSSSGATSTLSFTRTYQLAPNGLLRITSLVNSAEVAYGGVSAIGPSAFVASATEGTNVDTLVAIPASTNATNAALTGSYTIGMIDFLNADVTMVREATFGLTSNGAGSLGNLTVNGIAANLGGTSTTQTVSGATYAISGPGSGTANFGAASASQLLSGNKNLYVSADGNIILGGSPTGYDLIVGIRSLSSPASNATMVGDYYVAGLEDSAGNATTPDSIDAYYGSVAATGTGTSVFHNRFQSFQYYVYDYTYDSLYTVNANGTISTGDVPYNFTLGANGKAFIGTGAPGQSLYSLVVGFGTPTYSGTGTYLNPLGVVNAANSAPITNPIAPNEFVALYGTGLASATVQAPTLPLPTSLGNVQVTVNGIAAPLFYVSPTQIAFLVPSSISQANNVFYATVQVTNNNVKSNPVTVYTSNTAPGIFTQTGNGIGEAAAQRSNYSLITPGNPAPTGETIILYAGGLGSVSPATADGAAAPGNPLSNVTAQTLVDFGGTSGNVSFAGLTPGLAGLYQINVTVPSGPSTGTYYLDISTPDAYASQATTDITAKAGAAVPSEATALPKSVVRRNAVRRPNRPASLMPKAESARNQQIMPIQ